MNAATWILLAIAGGLGAACRFHMDAWVERTRQRWHAAHTPHPVGPARRHTRLAGVPLGTLAVNLTACLLLGLLTSYLPRIGTDLTGTPAAVSRGTGASGGIGHQTLTILGTGLCGGYSTFSTASIESARLILGGRPAAGVGLAATMTLTCQGATVLGLLLGGILPA